VGIFSSVSSNSKAEQSQKTSKLLREAVDAYTKSVNEGLNQYNETRKKAEEEINRGARITKHRINL